MYSVVQFAHMLQDRPRIDAYTESMRRSIRPGDVVADIGCGTGYFSLLACQLGARQVYAIEPLEVIELARECARASGMADRITFIRDLSTRIDLPEKADVIVSDLRGALPVHSNHLPSLLDARERLLAPAGILICQRDTLFTALIENPMGHDRCVRIWDSLVGVDQRACRNVAVNTRVSVEFDESVRLGSPQAWATIDYRCHTKADVRGEVDWLTERPFLAHGLCQWFQAEYAGGVQYTNGPSHPGTPTYNRLFFPWPAEVHLDAGMRVVVRLEARFVGTEYVWTWETRILGKAGETQASFSQSSLLDRPLAGAHLERRSPHFRPTLDEDGAATRTALTLMDGQRSQRAIADELIAAFPRRFATPDEALDFVTLLSLQFSR